MKYFNAVKLWNDNEKNKNKNAAYCSPSKGTKEYYEVLKKMEGKPNIASTVLHAVVHRNQTKQIKPVKKTNLMDLPDNILDTIGDMVKKQNRDQDVEDICTLKLKKTETSILSNLPSFKFINEWIEEIKLEKKMYLNRGITTYKKLKEYLLDHSYFSTSYFSIQKEQNKFLKETKKKL